MKTAAATALLAALMFGCARSPSVEPVTDDEDVVPVDAGAPEVSPRVRTYCPVGERPLFFVGSPEECEVIRFDCPDGTRLVFDEKCGCGCDY